MNPLDGSELRNSDTLVVGGTGNVGFYLVDGFIRAGSARVIVPTRSSERPERLLQRLGPEKAQRIKPILDDVGSVDGARRIRDEVAAVSGELGAVVASLASWHQSSSMLRAGFADFRTVIDTRLYPHFLAAETFVPLLAPDGAYTAINGPAAFAGLPQPAYWGDLCNRSGAEPPHPGGSCRNARTSPGE
ncbi:SDR family NAD(P)-dependent oxidoreductase [Leifsonia sp. AG29]|uniref:SDR family NAD(P)-dependent oxidoreductase n=1 Tax=Leifsonia sp. AG29 TaxID=2598860 RepID=UPI00131C678D|nr:SDR family NAD(P)-dependent oxidoreductase [Leifsonia sp. AG29]